MARARGAAPDVTAAAHSSSGPIGLNPYAPDGDPKPLLLSPPATSQFAPRLASCLGHAQRPVLGA